jgi:hypothetical protein
MARRHSNLRPAPFSITPEIVRGALGLAARSSRRLVAVPVEPIKLVDRPRRSEDPRLAKANDEQIIDFDPPADPETQAPQERGSAWDGPNGEDRGDGAIADDSPPQPEEIQLRLPVHPIPHCAGEPEPPLVDIGPLREAAPRRERIDLRSAPSAMERLAESWRNGGADDYGQGTSEPAGFRV